MVLFWTGVCEDDQAGKGRDRRLAATKQVLERGLNAQGSDPMVTLAMLA